MSESLSNQSNQVQLQIAASKHELATAEQKLVAAEQKLVAAKTELAAAKEKKDDDLIQSAREQLNNANLAVKSATEGVSTCQKLVTALTEKYIQLQNMSTSSINNDNNNNNNNNINNNNNNNNNNNSNAIDLLLKEMQNLRLENKQQIEGIDNKITSIQQAKWRPDDSERSSTVTRYYQIRLKQQLITSHSLSFGNAAVTAQNRMQAYLPPQDKRAKEELYYQDIFNSLTLLVHSELELVDTHSNGFLQTHAPDFSIVSKGNLPLESSVESVIEFKPKKLTDAHRGQIMLYADLILDVQIHRPYVIVILFSLEQLEVWRVNRDLRTQHRTYNYKSFDFKITNSAGTLLTWLLSQSPEFFGRKTHLLFNSRKIPIRCLSGGASSLVYLSETDRAVYKVFDPDEKTAFKQEAYVLEQLKSEIGIPTLVEAEEKLLILQLKECGDHITTVPTTTQVLSALSCLHLAHERLQIVHRDFRPSNLVIYAGNLLVLDWAYSCKVNEYVDYAGANHYASDRILNLLSKGERRFAVTFADDLESFIRCFFVLTYRNFQQKLHDIRTNDYSAIIQFWSYLSKFPFWITLQTTVRNGSANNIYEYLKQTISTCAIFPL